MSITRLLLPIVLLTSCGCSHRLCGPSGIAPQRLAVTGPAGERVDAAADGNLDTAWVSQCPRTTGLGLTIQLPKRMAVHRVFLTCGREEAWFPRSLRVLVGDSPDEMALAAEEVCYEGGDVGAVREPPLQAAPRLARQAHEGRLVQDPLHDQPRAGGLRRQPHRRARPPAPRVPGLRHPPARCARLVRVRPLHAGHRDLPTDSPKNARMKGIMAEWSRKCAHLGLWDYALIHMDAGGEWRTVTPRRPGPRRPLPVHAQAGPPPRRHPGLPPL